MRRGDVVLRALAALPIGYAVASLWAMALARILPGGPSEATITATLIAFVIAAAAAMWSFAASSGVRAVAVLLLLGGIAAAISWAAAGPLVAA